MNDDYSVERNEGMSLDPPKFDEITPVYRVGVDDPIKRQHPVIRDRESQRTGAMMTTHVIVTIPHTNIEMIVVHGAMNSEATK